MNVAISLDPFGRITSRRPINIPDEQPEPGEQVVSAEYADSLPVALRSQETDVILQRLTPTESQALFTARQQNWQIDRLITRATATGSISEADPEFPTARTALDAAGIIAAARWDELLAP
jgi:hypothetical protein